MSFECLAIDAKHELKHMHMHACMHARRHAPAHANTRTRTHACTSVVARTRGCTPSGTPRRNPNCIPMVSQHVLKLNDRANYFQIRLTIVTYLPWLSLSPLIGVLIFSVCSPVASSDTNWKTNTDTCIHTTI